jgi:hypothetical protein
MKTMWNRRFRLFIGTNGGNILHGLHLRFSRLGPAGMFSTVPTVPPENRPRFPAYNDLTGTNMKFAALFLCATAVFAQRPLDQQAAVVLANRPTAQTAQEMLTTVRAVADVTDVSFDEAQLTFTLRGPANLLGLAEWLLRAMDKPAGWQPTTGESENVALREYHLPKGPFPDPRAEWAPVARIYYLTNTTNRQQGIQEILTVLRAVGEIQKVFNCTAPHIIAFRGPAADVDLGEWLLRKLDVPAGAEAYARQKENPDADMLKLPSTPVGIEDIVQVFYLTPATTGKETNALAAKIRAATDTRTIFQKTAPPTIVVRGTSAQLAQAQQIVDSQ